MNIDSTVKADAEQIHKAKAVVKKLRFPYTPYNFDNPKLQTHWRNIEALALDYNELREVKDVTGNVSFILVQQHVQVVSVFWPTLWNHDVL